MERAPAPPRAEPPSPPLRHDAPDAAPPPEKPSRKRPPVAPKPAGDEEARNDPPIALLLAERLTSGDKVVTLRVHAEAGEYFNCYYKDREASYYHLRLHDDGSAYLDGYVPRDAAGEQLRVMLKKRKSLDLTVKLVMRPETVSSVCVGQVDVVDHRVGWDFTAGGLAPAGALARRIANARDRVPAHDEPSVATFLQTRERYIDKAVVFRVHARLDRYYQCRYRDAERTHYAVLLNGDAFTGLRAFIPRSEAGKALARLLATDEGARITATVTVPKGRYDEVCGDQAEILSWEPGWKGIAPP